MSEGGVVASLLQTWRLRASDPFLGPFITAAIVGHWKFFYLLTSGVRDARGANDAVATIAAAESQLSGRVLLAALVFAVLYVYGYPRARVCFVSFWETWRVKADSAKRKAENRGVMTLAEWKRHPEWIDLAGQIADWRKFASDLLSAAVSGPDVAHGFGMYKDDAQGLNVPGFHRQDPADSDRLLALHEPRKGDQIDIKFAFRRIGSWVVAAGDRSVVLWPRTYSDAAALGLGADGQLIVGSGSGACVERLGQTAFGVAKLRPQS